MHIPKMKMNTYPKRIVSGCRMKRYLKRTDADDFSNAAFVMIGNDPMCEPRSCELWLWWWLCELRQTLLGLSERIPKTRMNTSATRERGRIAWCCWSW